jgi:hypothetical protein
MSLKKKKRKTESDILKAKDKRLCLICEKEINLIEHNSNMLDGGGFIEASFGYGSKHDQIGLRLPKHDPFDPVLKDHPGYSACDLGKIFGGEKDKGKTVYIPNGSFPIESMPIPGIENEDIVTRILSSYRVCSYICDECFEKKIHLFYGEEK